MTLFRPVGPKELDLIKDAGYRRFPPRLPEQPIFYPVVQKSYAEWIARHWNVRDSGAGFVTQFEVDAEYISTFEPHAVGGQRNTEYWIPAEELEEFNDHIVGQIQVVGEYRAL